MFYGIYVQQAIGKMEKCLVDCQVTKAHLSLPALIFKQY